MKKTMVFTTLICLACFLGIVSCSKDDGNSIQNNNPNNPNNPNEPFTGCHLTDGTAPASFTFKGVNYTVNDLAIAKLLEGENVSVQLGWDDGGENRIYLELIIKKDAFKGPGHYSTRNGDNILITVTVNKPDGEVEAYYYEKGIPEVSYLEICIDEVEMGKSIKGYFNANLRGSSDLIHTDISASFTNGYFEIIK